MLSRNSDLPFGRALFVALVALAFWSVLEWVEPLYFLRDDNSTYYLPAYVHSYRSLVEGSGIAQGNPHQYLGIPHLAFGQPAVLYPPTYLAVALASALGDVRWAVDLLAAAHVVAAALGMLFLLRRLGLGRGGGDVAGSLLWLTAPFAVILARAWLPFAYSAAFLPWSLWLLLRLLERPNWGRAAAYGSVKTLFFFSGYPQMLVYSTLLEGLYWIALRTVAAYRREPESLRTARRQAAALGGAALWTLTTSAPLLLPMMATLDASFMRRNPLPLEVFAEFPLRVGDFLWAQIFVFREKVFITAGSSIYVLGLPFLAGLAYFFVLCIARRRHLSDRTERRITTLAIVGLLALVAATSAWRLAYGLPLVSTFRWPAKFFLFFVFGSIPAVAQVYERLAERRPRWAHLALFVTLGCALAVLVVPPWRATMGGAGLDRPVEEYEQRLDELCRDGGRLVAFRQDGTLSAEEWDDLAPYLGAYNYATLFGRHQLGGYEPLLSSLHFELSAGMNYTATLPVRQAGPQLFRHSAHWGVRCLLVPDLPGAHGPFLEAGLQHTESANGIVAYRLDGAPIVSWRSRPDQDVPFRWTASGLEAEVDGGGGVLRIAVAPLLQWSVEVSGDEGKALSAEWQIDSRLGLVVQVPDGARNLRVTYREPAFEAGLWAASLTVSAALLAWLFARRRT